LTLLTQRITWITQRYGQSALKTDPYSPKADIESELRFASGGLPVGDIRSMDEVLDAIGYA